MQCVMEYIAYTASDEPDALNYVLFSYMKLIKAIRDSRGSFYLDDFQIIIKFCVFNLSFKNPLLSEDRTAPHRILTIVYLYSLSTKYI